MDKTFKVRDGRHKEKFFLDDAYLNGYAKIVGPYCTCVYLSLCRHADTQQKSFPSIDKLAEEHGISRSSVIRSLKALTDHNLVCIEHEKAENGASKNNTYVLLDKSVWGKPPVSCGNGGGVSQIPSGVSDSHSKDTHIQGSVTNVTGDVRKRTCTCPLENKNGLYKDLIGKYPNGHQECVEFLLSLEEDGHKFINKGKQFKAIHNILRANYSFKSIDWAISKMEKDKFYQERGWDLGSVASYLEKARYGQK